MKLIGEDIKKTQKWINKQFAWLFVAFSIATTVASVSGLVESNDIGVWALLASAAAVLMTIVILSAVLLGQRPGAAKGLTPPLHRRSYLLLWALLLAISLNCWNRAPDTWRNLPPAAFILLAVIGMIILVYRKEGHWPAGYTCVLILLTGLFISAASSTAFAVKKKEYADMRKTYQTFAETKFRWANGNDDLHRTLIEFEMRAFDLAYPEPVGLWDHVFAWTARPANGTIEIGRFKFRAF